MKKLPEKIILFIDWENRFVTADACEVIDIIQGDDDLFMMFLEECHPDSAYDEEEDLPTEYFDEFRDFCFDQLQTGWGDWEIKEVDFPY